MLAIELELNYVTTYVATENNNQFYSRVCSVAWPLSGSEVGVDFVCYKLQSYSYVNENRSE